MLGAGLRVSEAINLRHEHLDLEERSLVVREGKGAKDRTLWFTPEVQASLEGWFQHDEAHPLEGLVFTTLDGGPLSSRYLRDMVKRHAKKAEVSEAHRVSTHVLRNTFATMLYADTANLRLVQKSLGHASITTAEVYNHIHDHDMLDALHGESEAA
jgi:site-specific recombinase XerD